MCLRWPAVSFCAILFGIVLLGGVTSGAEEKRPEKLVIVGRVHSMVLHVHDNSAHTILAVEKENGEVMTIKFTADVESRVQLDTRVKIVYRKSTTEEGCAALRNYCPLDNQPLFKLLRVERLD